jgi:phospholipid-translocating ATPase
LEDKGFSTKEDLDLNQFLHRGTTLKNSGRVLAMVVYTGTDTKLIKNFGNYKFKRPQFENLLNVIIGVQAAIFLIGCVILTVCNIYFNRKNYDKQPWIFDKGPSASALSSKVFWSFWLMLNTLMPLEVECAV